MLTDALYHVPPPGRACATPVFVPEESLSAHSFDIETLDPDFEAAAAIIQRSWDTPQLPSVTAPCASVETLLPNHGEVLQATTELVSHQAPEHESQPTSPSSEQENLKETCLQGPSDVTNEAGLDTSSVEVDLHTSVIERQVRVAERSMSEPFAAVRTALDKDAAPNTQRRDSEPSATHLRESEVNISPTVIQAVSLHQREVQQQVKDKHNFVGIQLSRAEGSLGEAIPECVAPSLHKDSSRSEAIIIDTNNGEPITINDTTDEESEVFDMRDNEPIIIDDSTDDEDDQSGSNDSIVPDASLHYPGNGRRVRCRRKTQAAVYGRIQKIHEGRDLPQNAHGTLFRIGRWT